MILLILINLLYILYALIEVKRSIKNIRIYKRFICNLKHLKESSNH